MSLTIKDVAKAANVSIATVSRVLNGKDKVKKETREKIQAAIIKLNYLPDQAARTMKMNRTKTIGMLVPVLSNEFWAELSEIIQNSLLSKGYTLIIGSGNFQEESYDAFLKTCIERKIDGLILGKMLPDDTNRLVDLANQGCPVVTFGSVNDKFVSICGDYINSAISAVEHLIHLGHREIAYIGAASTSVERELGYRNALMLNAIEIDEKIIIGGRNDYIHQFSQYGYQCAKALIASRQKFTALFGANDLIAIGAIKALDEQRIRVPQDVAVVGVDDITMASLYRPSLTTLKQPIREMADAAVEIVLEQIEKPEKARSTRKITFPMELIVRESSRSSE